MGEMTRAAPDLAIELTTREQVLAARIDFDPSPTLHNADTWKAGADAIQELMGSLLERNAIPLARRKFFTDPSCLIGGHGLSHLQVFERNGTRGDDIFRHPHFVKYLRYFLYGPDLPKEVIALFQKKVANCGSPFTSGDALAVADFARDLTRSRGLEPHGTAEEFFKLALDCRLDLDDARAVRDSVKRVR
jgi:hypothetical protein